MTRHLLSTDPVHRRLAPLLAASFFGGVAFWVPVEKLFLSEIGFTPQTIGLMAAAYAAAVPLLEVPSGILADRWSRRGVLAIGHGAVFLSVLIGGLSTNVPTYVAAALLLGVYFAMQSGTFEAIVYDLVLEETGASDRFESLIGRMRVAESASLVLGALAGGLLAALTAPRVTYFATLPFIAVSLPFLMAFREPHLHQGGESRSLRQHVAVTLGTLRHETRLLPVAGLMILTALLTQAVFEFGPLWLIDSGAGAGAFGPTWAALMASLGLGGALAARVRFESRGTLGVVVGLLLVASVTLLLASDVVVVTVAQVVLVVIAVALGIFLTRLLHDAIESDVRTGVASGVGAATWLTFLPFAVGFGALTERAGIHTAGWLVVGLAAAVGGLLLLVVASQRETAAVPAAADGAEAAEAAERGAIRPAVLAAAAEAAA